MRQHSESEAFGGLPYAEDVSKRWSIGCLIAYVGWMGWIGRDFIPSETGTWLIICLMALPLLAAFLAVPFSKHMYHRIRVDKEKMRVGRETIPVRELDPESIATARQASVPNTTDRHAASLGNIDAPLPKLRAHQRGAPRLVGGAWATPLGMDTIVISTRSGEHLSIATRDRHALLAALEAATAQGSK